MVGYKLTDLSSMTQYDPNDLVAVVDVSANVTRKYRLGDIGGGGNSDEVIQVFRVGAPVLDHYHTILLKQSHLNTLLTGTNVSIESDNITGHTHIVEFKYVVTPEYEHHIEVISISSNTIDNHTCLPIEFTPVGTGIKHIVFTSSINQTIDGVKTFVNPIKSDGIVSILNSNGGSYIDMNDGQVSIGTGLNSVDNIPEISIENWGYGMAVVFAPSDGTKFNTNASFDQGLNAGGLSVNNYNVSINGPELFINTSEFTTIYSKVRALGFFKPQFLVQEFKLWNTDGWHTNEIDVSLATYFQRTITSNTSFTLKPLTLPLSNNVSTIQHIRTIYLELTNAGAYSITWFPGTKWAGGVVPTLSTAGKDILEFTVMLGTNSIIEVYGVVKGKDFK